MSRSTTTSSEHEGFTRFDDAALVEIFKEGLLAGILSHCYGLEAVPLTLAAWKEKSRLFYRNYIELQQWQQHSRGPQPQQCQQQHQPQPGSSRQGGRNPPASTPTSTTAPVKLETTMPNWAGLVMANVITAAGKDIGHKTAPRKAQVPDAVAHRSNAAR
jgi:hypothetical protein